MHLFEGASLAPASVAHLFESELKDIVSAESKLSVFE
jgi:hypothetical protein